MIIKRLFVQNYKCLENTFIHNLDHIIAIVGSNMSGKSTFFDSLLFLRDGYNTNLKAALLDRNGFKSLITRGEVGKDKKIKILIDIEVDTGTRDLLLYQMVNQKEPQFKRIYDSDFLKYLYYFIEFRISTDNDYYLESLSTDNVGKNQRIEIVKISTRFPESKQLISINNLQEQLVNVLRGGSFDDGPQNAEQIWNLENFRCLFNNKSQRRRELEYKIIDVIESFVLKWQSLSPFIAIQENFSSSATRQMDHDAKNISGVIHTLHSSKPEKINEIKSLLSQIINIDDLFTPIAESTTTIAIKEKNQSNDIEIKNLSAGFKYILAVITRLVTAEPGSLIMLEEPENHLHPKAIRQLIQILQNYSLMHQILFTTHSPVALLNFSIDNIFLTERIDNGSTSVSRITNDNVDSIIDNLGIYPSDFFEHDLIIFVEGKFDVAIYNSFSKKTDKTKTNICFIDTEGWTNMPFYADAKILKKLRLQPIVMVILDGDTKDKKQERAYSNVVSQMNLPAKNIKHLKEKEIECYILNSAAWLKKYPSIKLTEDELNKEFMKIKSDEKPRHAIEQFMETNNLGYYTIDVAKEIVLNMDSIPSEIAEILNYIHSLLQKK